LVHWTVCVFCGFPERLLWFWFYNTQLKTALSRIKTKTKTKQTNKKNKKTKTKTKKTQTGKNNQTNATWKSAFKTSLKEHQLRIFVCLNIS